jgi:hypothetical protein
MEADGRSPRDTGYLSLAGKQKMTLRGETLVRYFFLALRDAFRAYQRSKQYHYPSNVEARKRY